MKHACILAFALLFVATAGFAAPLAPAPLSAATLAQILGQPAADGACGLPQGAVAAAAKPGKPNRPPSGQNKALCSATALCATGTVYCDSNVSTTSCAAYDRSCPGEQGHVTCAGVTTWCPTACSGGGTCTTGTIRQRACCRCAETENCWDCDFCANGFHTIDACP